MGSFGGEKKGGVKKAFKIQKIDRDLRGCSL